MALNPSSFNPFLKDFILIVGKSLWWIWNSIDEKPWIWEICQRVGKIKKEDLNTSDFNPQRGQSKIALAW